MVRMYVTRTCPYCQAAERLLTRLGVAYEKYDLSADPERRRRLVEETGWRTVPVIFVGDRMIGGYEDLKKLHESGELTDMVHGAPQP
jgi:glutaredoxin 3